MTVQELLDRLAEEDPAAEVRIMSQPSWPFEYTISGTWTPDASDAPDCECGHDKWLHDHPDGNEWHAERCGCPSYSTGADGFVPFDAPEAGVVYLTEGRQLAYGTKDAWS